jgi:hypothetical protein
VVTPARAPDRPATPAPGPLPWPPDSVNSVNSVAAPGERHLLAAIERLARAPDGWAAVALQLSRLGPASLRPYHRRVAQALMQGAALRGDGQVFNIRNGDIVLLCRDTPAVSSATTQALAALFAREGDETVPLVHEWRLPHGSAALLGYAVERLGENLGGAPEEPPLPEAGLVDAVAIAIAGARPQDLLHRQTAALIELAGGGTRVTMRVLYREITFSLETLEARLDAPARLGQDMPLLLHLGRFLDQRMLRVLRLGQGSGSPLDIAAPEKIALHVNLTLPGVLSDEFAELAARCQAAGLGLGVEVSLVEAVADPGGWAQARARLRESGVRLVFDGVGHQALLLARPAELGADMIKLDWTPRMASLPGGELAGAIAAADPSRLILHRAESEAAVRWGLMQGVRCFQGRHIDQMLAAQRMLACPASAACMLRQCVARAAATGADGRAGCANLPLLDAGLPAGRAPP